MSLRRFLVNPDAIRGRTAEISGPELRHLKDVLRLRPGETVELLDPRGAIMTARIESLGRDRAILAITASRRAEDTGRTCLAAGILKGARMDLVVEKAVEFGIGALIPLASRHTAAGRPRPGRMERWHRVASAACKQCGRATPLEITAPTELEELLERKDEFALGLMFHEKERKTRGSELAALPWGSAGVKIALVGPEGGFSSDETEKAARAGFVLVGLGRQVMRAETAAMAAMTIIRLFDGDDNGGN